jgi:hypothetical protein
MDTPLYDVYLTGKLAENISVAQATQRLATLFKSSPEVMAGMLTGKPQLLKRGLDKNAALKYREALLGAGVEVAFKAQTAAAPGPAVQKQTEVPAPPALSLAPAGSDVLQTAERAQPVAADIDTSALQLLPQSPLPAVAHVQVSAPDVSHLSVAAAGSDLLSEAEKQHPPFAVPDVSDLTLAPVGAALETLPTFAAPVQPDTSALSLAPAGSELLTAEQRSKPAAAAPRTDHLTLAS